MAGTSVQGCATGRWLVTRRQHFAVIEGRRASANRKRDGVNIGSSVEVAMRRCSDAQFTPAILYCSQFRCAWCFASLVHFRPGRSTSPSSSIGPGPAPAWMTRDALRSPQQHFATDQPARSGGPDSDTLLP